jgi:ABC-2 type transport system ATP-binding protein
MIALRVVDLKKSYQAGFLRQKKQVLHGVSFEIQKGRVVGFLGRNGAGKTTTIKCLLELAFKDSGTIEFFGSSTLSSRLKNKIGFLPERPYFYDYLTGREFLQFYANLSGMKKGPDLTRRMMDLLQKVDLVHAMDRPLRSYSKGMLQRVGIAQALVHDPDFVLLDEPMSGLDPDGRYKINSIIQSIGAMGKTVFFSSHLLNDMERLCQDLVIVNGGKTIFQGTTDSLLGHLQGGTRLRYRIQDQVREENLEKAQDVQARIDNLRAQRLEILEVEPIRPTLEEAFVKIAPLEVTL